MHLHEWNCTSHIVHNFHSVLLHLHDPHGNFIQLQKWSSQEGRGSERCRQWHTNIVIHCIVGTDIKVRELGTKRKHGSYILMCTYNVMDKLAYVPPGTSSTMALNTEMPRIIGALSTTLISNVPAHHGHIKAKKMCRQLTFNTPAAIASIQM